MDADQLVSFILDKKWLALAILVIGYITRLLSDESKFPLSVPARWRPAITVLLGQVLAGLMLVQGGASWKVAVTTGLAVSFATMGLFDLLVKAIFDGSPPWWLDIFALVFPKKDDVPKPPKLPTGLGLLAIVFCVGAVAEVDIGDREIRSPVEIAACKPANGPLVDADAAGIVEAGTQVATGICSLIDGIDDSGVVRTICATVEEVAEIISFILTLRDARDAGAPMTAACGYLPSTTFCATSSERAKAILFIVRARTARLAIDAGAR